MYSIPHKPVDPVLVIEDIRENQILLQKLVARSGLECDIAENGQIALDMARSKKYSFYIVDLMLPVMDGKTFMQELRKTDSDAVFLVQTAIDTSDTIIDIMKIGVFDYLIKPLDPDLFHQILAKTCDYIYLRDTEKNLSESAGLKLRSQLEWLNYKESRRRTGQDSNEILSIENLKTSLSQGAGVGTMVTLVDLIRAGVKDQGKEYTANKELMDLLFENNEYIRNLLDGLHQVSELFQSKSNLKETTAEEFNALIPGFIKDVIPYIEKKGQRLSMPVLRTNCRIATDNAQLSGAIEELVINACKYTVPGGRIDIFTHLTEGYYCISVKNDVSVQPFGGIPPEMEKLVVEPFFRILPPDESVAKIEKFGLGLGLTVTEHIARSHGGLFFIHTMQDHTGDSVRPCVVAEIFLPVNK